jgi:IS5 family transposase
MHAVLCGAGHNLRLILAALRLFCARWGVSLTAAFVWLNGLLPSLQPRIA